MSICNEKQVINFGSWNLVIHTKLMEGIDRLGRAEITTVWAMPVLAHPWLRACYSVFLVLRRAITKLSSEVGCGEVTNPK